MRRCYQTIDWCCYSVLTKSFYRRARATQLILTPIDFKVVLSFLIDRWTYQAMKHCCVHGFQIVTQKQIFSLPPSSSISLSAYHFEFLNGGDCCIEIFFWRRTKPESNHITFFVFLLSTPPPPYSSALNASSSALKPLFLLSYRITNPLLNFAYPKNKDYCFSAIYISRFYLLYWPVSLLHKVHFF